MTQCLTFSPPKSLNSLQENLGKLSPRIKLHARNLGIIFDSDLRFDKQINFQLRAISKVK